MDERIGRLIDGDLARRERIELLGEIATARGRLAELGEAIALERDLVDLAQAYEREPVPALARPVAARGRHAPGVVARLRERISQSRPGPILGGMVGAVAAAAVALGVFFHFSDHVQPRLQVVAVHFHVAADTIEWTRDYRLGPGSALDLDVELDHDQPINLRIQSDDELATTITHKRRGRRDLQHHVGQGKVGYATLHKPVKGDRLHIENKGGKLVELKVQEPAPSALRVHAAAGRPAGPVVAAGTQERRPRH